MEGLIFGILQCMKRELVKNGEREKGQGTASTLTPSSPPPPLPQPMTVLHKLGF